MKSIFTWLFLLTFLYAVKGQQPAQSSLYMLDKYAFNPAYAGMENSLAVTASYRKQWVGLEGSPETQRVGVHMPLYIAAGGIGFGLENETLGSWKQTSLMFTYDYQAPLNEGTLSIGLSGGIVQRQLDGSKVKTPATEFDDEGNPIDHHDVLLSVGTENGSAPALHVGVFYQGERLGIGVSAINLIENELDLGILTFKPERTYHLYLGYQMDIGRKLSVHPSVLLKSDIQQTQLDFSVLTRYNENIFVGASFRGYHSESIDAIALIGGFKLSEKISLGYAYDMTLSDLKTVSTGSHEILISYNLGKPIGKGRPPGIIYNPRSL